MSIGTLYHATPSMFSSLRKGSWVSTSLGEACLHLFMKNLDAGDHVDRFRGFVITIEDFPDDVIDESVVLGDVTNFTTKCDISIPGIESYMALDTAIKLLPENQQSIFYAKEIVDLKSLISS